MSEPTPKTELDALSGPDATDWFYWQQRAIRGQIIHCAHEYYRRVQADGPEAAESERAALFGAIEALAAAQAEQASYFAERRVRERAERQLNHQRNLEEGRRQHEEAVARARAEDKITDAVRKEQKATRAIQREELDRKIAAAHANPEPSPAPLVETREERIVNDQLRSFGSLIKIDTHNIEYRLRDKRERERAKR